jgi:hypothetical protein
VDILGRHVRSGQAQPPVVIEELFEAVEDGNSEDVCECRILVELEAYATCRFGQAEGDGHLRPSPNREARRRKAIDDLVGDFAFIGGQFEFDLPKSVAPSRSVEDVHDIVVDLAQRSIAVVAERQSLADRLESNDFSQRRTPDDTSGDVYDTAGNGVAVARPGHLGPLKG